MSGQRSVGITHTGAAVSAHGDPSQLIGQLSNPYSIRETRVVKTNSNLNLSTILSLNFSFVLKPWLLIANCQGWRQIVADNLTRTLSFAENIEAEQNRFQETTELLSHVLEMKPTKEQDDLVCKCVPQKLNLAPFIIRE